MSLEATVIRIERKVDALAKPKPFWVSAEVIMEKTGWNKSQMYAYRKINREFYTIKKGGGYVYNLSIVPETLLKK